MKYTCPQFGYINIGNLYISTDPIGITISKIETCILWLKYIGQIIKYKGDIKQSRWIFSVYSHNLWHKWDIFYRCKLRIPYKIHTVFYSKYENSLLRF